MLDDDDGADAAAHRKVTFDAQLAWANRRDDVVGNLVGDFFVECAFVAE